MTLLTAEAHFSCPDEDGADRYTVKLQACNQINDG